MKDMRQAKVSQEGLLGAVSQAKMIYTLLRDGGIAVPEVNDEGMSEGDSLFTYLNAIYGAVGKDGIPVKTVEVPVAQPPASPSTSFPRQEAPKPVPVSASSPIPAFNLKKWEDDLTKSAVRAFLDADNQRRAQQEAERLESGKMSAEQWIEAKAEAVVNLGSEYKRISEEYSTIIDDYDEAMKTANQMRKTIVDSNQKVSDSLSSLDGTLKPLVPVAQEALESFRMTHWKLFKRWFKRWITRCKDNPRWKNPYTYAYIFIGLVFLLSVYSNIDLRIKNSRLLQENQTHRMVDVLMEVYPVYRKERTMVQEFIDNQGLSYTWDKVLEMRARVDSVEAAKGKQK